LPTGCAKQSALTRLFGGTRLGGAPSELANRFTTTYVSSYYMELLRSDLLLQPLTKHRWSNNQTLADLFDLKDSPDTNLERQVLTLLRKRVLSIRQDVETAMLTVRCTTPDPVTSSEMADELVEGLKTFLLESQTSGTSELLRLAEERTSQAQAALNRAELQLRDFRERNKTIISAKLKMEESKHEREVTLQEEQFIQLKTKLEMLRLTWQQEVDLINVIQPAEIPRKKSWPPTAAAVVGSAFFGFLLAVSIAFVRHGIGTLAARDAPGFLEFATHIRALNRFLPGLALLLPRHARKRKRPSSPPAPLAQSASDEGDES